MKLLRKLVLLVVCWLFASLSAHVFAQTINVSPHGTLKNAADIIETATQLTLTGEIDASDIAFIRENIPNLVVLDLSETTIVEYSGQEGTYPNGYYNYSANTMPQYSFYNPITGTSNTLLTSVILPAGLTSIGDDAFWNCGSLTEINLPDGVTSIGYEAFSSCSSLKEINLPDGLTYIGSWAFEYCSSLAEINLPDGLTYIGSSAFYYCSSLAEINLPAGLTSIGYGMFLSCRSLTEITIPDGVTSIGSSAFYNCSSLTEINLPDGVTSIGSSAFSSCSSLAEINLPAGLTSIEYGMFSSCSSLTEINLPAGLTSISDYAFYNCSSLTEINLPAGVTSIGSSAFASCYNLAEINLSDGVTFIGSSAFSSCSSLTEINLPDGLTSIGSSAFSSCSNLKEINLPDRLTSIGDNAFNSCYSLEEITLPAGLTSIGNAAFAYNTGLNSITNLNPVPVNINSNVFNGVNKSGCELTVPSSSVDDYKDASGWGEFSDKIKDGGLSFSVTVNNGALGSVDGLSTGLYPSGTAINLKANPVDGYIFLGWTSGGTTVESGTTYNSTLTKNTLLTAVFGNSLSPDLTTAGTLKNVAGIATATHLTLTGKIDARDIAFMRDSIPNLAVLDLSRATIVRYEGDGGTLGYNNYPANEMPPYSFYNTNTGQGKTSLTSIILPDGVTSIGNDAFWNCSNLTEINLPDGLTSIGNYAFESCSSLTEINLPDGVTSIGNAVFYNCSNLKEITLPDKLTSIGNNVFESCSSLTEINLPAGLTSIGYGAFYNCRSLTEINLPAGLTSIGNYAFESCSSLTEINLPAGLTSIGADVFNNCSSLTEINLPAGLTSIENSAFSSCSSLTEITLPAGLTSIGNYAFSYCSSLTEINLPAGLTSIGYGAFMYCYALDSITNLNPDPVYIENNVFYGVNKSVCALTVPSGSVDAYKSTYVWLEFYDNIKGAGLSFNVSVNNGAMGSVEGQTSGLYTSGTVINLTANPADGYNFLRWTSGGTTVGTGTTFSRTLTDNLAVTAVFGKILSPDRLTSAGTLKDVAGIASATHLTLTGEIDARDIAFIRDHIPYLVELDLSGATIVGYRGADGTYPWGDNSYPANEMPQYSFHNSNTGQGKTSLTSIILPDGVTSIGYEAFWNCSNLTEITLPNGLTSIGNYAFENCSSLKEITLPAGVTSIGGSAFYYNTGLRSIINLNPDPIYIDSYVFNGVNKSVCELTVPSSSVDAYKDANGWREFYDNIKDGGLSFNVSVSNGAMSSVTGQSSGLYTSGTAINLTATTADGYFFLGWTIGGTTVETGTTFSRTLTDNLAVTAVFGKILSPDRLTTAGTLKDVAGIASATHLTLTGEIDARDIAFIRDGIPYLVELDLSGATIVGYEGPDGTYPGGNNSYPANEMPVFSFYSPYTGQGKTSLTSVILPDGLTSIGESAFNNCSSLTEITIPAGLTSLGGNAFMYCGSLTEINLPDRLTSIGDGAFYNCGSLTEINLPAGLTSIGVYAFYNCSSLTEINLPSGLTSLGNNAFYNCSSLTEITLPAGLTSIGYSAFYNCSSLTEIINLNLVPVYIDGSVFNGVDKSVCKLTVPSSSVDAYKVAYGWLEFYDKITGGGLSFSVTVNNGALGSVTGTSSGLYSSDTDINITANPFAGYIFSGWISGGNIVGTGTTHSQKLTDNFAITAVFGKSLSPTLTDAGTLKDVAGIETATYLTLTGKIDARDIAFIRDRIPYLTGLDLSGATIVEYEGTEGTVSLETAYPANEMPEYSFYNGNTDRSRTSLASVTLPKGLTSIGERAFNNCSSLTEIAIPDGVTSIGYSAFSNCSSLTEITVPAGVTSLGSNAFAYCFSLTSVTLLEGVTSIGDYAFLNCRSLTDINLPDGLTSIGNDAFMYCGLTNISLPEGLTSIGDYAFYNCSGLTSVTFPEGLNSLGSDAFAYCFSLNEIILPDGLNYIGDGAFAYNSGLTSILNLNPVPAIISSSVFDGVNKNVCTLNVLYDYVDDYKGANVWKTFYNIEGISGTYTVTVTADSKGEATGGGDYTAGAYATINATPKTAGYGFKSWTSAGRVVSISAQYRFPVVADVDLQANFEAITYHIKYDNLYGVINENPSVYTVDSATLTLKDPATKREGYTFTGWKEGNTIATGSTGDKTFTAEWSPIVYAITYVLEGGDNHVDNPDTYTIESPTITLQDPTREDYVFDYWNEGNTIATGSTGDKTFTALWKYVVIKIEDITINGTGTAELSAVNDSVFEYTAQDCDETSISLDLGVSSQTNVTINGETYAPGTEITFGEGNLTTIEIAVEPEAGGKKYTLQIAAPLTDNALYYRRWNDVVAVNQNPATNGGHDVSDVRWYKPDGTIDNSVFISIPDADSENGYYAEVKTVETGVWHHVCAVIETKSSEKITAYPNPVSRGETVTVKLPASYVNSTLNIYDMKGGLVKSGQSLPTTVNSVDVSEFVPGIYLLRITDKKGNSETVKIIVNN
jgi:uncharacterized repeat protein (TIGR02543 family)